MQTKEKENTQARTPKPKTGFEGYRYPSDYIVNPYALTSISLDLNYHQATLVSKEEDTMCVIKEKLLSHLENTGNKVCKPSRKERRVRSRITRGKLRYIWTEDSDVPLNNIAVYAMVHCTDLILTEVEVASLRFRLTQELRNSGLDFTHGLPERLRESDTAEDQAKREVWLARLNAYYQSREHLVIEDAINIVRSPEYVEEALSRRRNNYYLRETGALMRRGLLPQGVLQRSWMQWLREIFVGSTLRETPL